MTTPARAATLARTLADLARADVHPLVLTNPGRDAPAETRAAGLAACRHATRAGRHLLFLEDDNRVTGFDFYLRHVARTDGALVAVPNPIDHVGADPARERWRSPTAGRKWRSAA